VNRLGKSLLAIKRSFHRWHRLHLSVSLAVVIGALLVAALCAILRAPQFYRHLSERLFEIEEYIGYFSLAFFAAAISAGILMTWLARVWPTPYVPLVTNLPEPLEEPASSHWIFGDYLGSKFRFRLASKADLKLFAEMSAGDPAVEIANPGLDRVSLYKSWYATNPKTFMFLDVQKPGETGWNVGAISIVVPLSRDGFDALWSGRSEVKDLGASDLVREGSRPRAILIDTLIAEPAYRKRNAGMVFSLSVVHASRFWAPFGRRKIEYFIEPDHRKFPHLLPKMGFEGPHDIQRGHKLFKLTYPIAKKQIAERTEETSTLLIENVRTASKWTIRV
jgi:hypothetical protein